MTRHERKRGQPLLFALRALAAQRRGRGYPELRRNRGPARQGAAGFSAGRAGLVKQPRQRHAGGGTQAAANYRVAALDLVGEQVTFSKHQVEYQVQRVGEIIVRPLDQSDASYSIAKGQPGDLCPPCAKQQLGSLGHWQGHGGAHFPAELLPLRLFKCCMWLWLVVPGLRDDEPQQRL